jgi:hypothetical protein
MQPTRSLRLSLCLLALVGFTASARAQNFTLEQVLRSPFPSEPAVSRQSDKYTWVKTGCALTTQCLTFLIGS